MQPKFKSLSKQYKTKLMTGTKEKIIIFINYFPFYNLINSVSLSHTVNFGHSPYVYINYLLLIKKYCPEKIA